jgi:hypothetical protein
MGVFMNNQNEVWELLKEKKSFWILPIAAVLALLLILLWMVSVTPAQVNLPF